VFLLEIRAIIITLGLSFDLIGGVLLASEMIGLLDIVLKKVRNLHSKIQERKASAENILGKFGLIIVIVTIFSSLFKNTPEPKHKATKIATLRGSLDTIKYKIIIYILTILLILTYKVLLYLENFTIKYGTKKVVGLVGVFFLCLGFVFQAIVNFMAI
jgi:hypothetical protein